MLQARDVSIGWSRDEVLLEHASFEVREGEIFGILGRSACGKTTLLRVLIGLEEPLEGQITIEGVGAPGLRAGRPAFGVMFQQGALFGSMTVGQNVALPLERWTDLPSDAIRAMVEAKLRLVGLEAAEHQLPSTLSGGMRKRAAIARAMALEPSLLFLDEPSSGLDPVTSAELDRLIATLARVLGLTVVLVTHELGSIHGIVDRCIMLDRESKSILALRCAARPSREPSSSRSALLQPRAGGRLMSAASTHFKLGIFTVLAIVAVLAAAFGLGWRGVKSDTVRYHTYFDETVQGLELGSPVKYRGVLIGSVDGHPHRAGSQARGRDARAEHRAGRRAGAREGDPGGPRAARHPGHHGREVHRHRPLRSEDQSSSAAPVSTRGELHSGRGRRS